MVRNWFVIVYILHWGDHVCLHFGHQHKLNFKTKKLHIARKAYLQILWVFAPGYTLPPSHDPNVLEFDHPIYNKILPNTSQAPRTLSPPSLPPKLKTTSLSINQMWNLQKSVCDCVQILSKMALNNTDLWWLTAF